MTDTNKKRPTKDNQDTSTEVIADLQRVRADFENFRKRSDIEKQQAKEIGFMQAVLKLLPIIDNIERAIKYMPEDLADNPWANSVSGLTKQLDKSLSELNIERINSAPGTVFNPELHDAIQFNEDASGETEIIQEELQSGYLYQSVPIRHSMVKVTKK